MGKKFFDSRILQIDIYGHPRVVFGFQIVKKLFDRHALAQTEKRHKTQKP
jgi:hypothetical protein